MEQMVNNKYIITGIDQDNNILKTYTLVEEKDSEEVEVVSRIIEKVLNLVFDEKHDTNLRDAYLICLYKNYDNCLNKYFSWFKNYLYFSEIEDSIIKEDFIYENIFTDDPLIKINIKIMNDNSLLKKHQQLKTLVDVLRIKKDNYLAVKEIISNLKEYEDLIIMYYPEIYNKRQELIEVNEFNNIENEEESLTR